MAGPETEREFPWQIRRELPACCGKYSRTWYNIRDFFRSGCVCVQLWVAPRHYRAVGSLRL